MCPKCARRGAVPRERPSTRQCQENIMRKILIAATAVMLATGASLFGASAADKLKVGFIYLGPVGDLGWTYQHDLGRLAMLKEFGDKVETTYLENVSESPHSDRSIA